MYHSTRPNRPPHTFRPNRPNPPTTSGGPGVPRGSRPGWSRWRLAESLALALVALVALVTMVACASPSSTRCDDGTVCPPGKECVGYQCVSISCGDGVRDSDPTLGLDEECDCGETAGVVPPGCDGPNNDRSGTCRSDCRLHCGDGVVNAEEDCDGAPPPGQSCIQLGFDIGQLTCSDTCTVEGSAGCRYLGWARQSRRTVENLRAVWGESEREVYAVGWEGAVLRFDGTRWEPLLVDDNDEPMYGDRRFFSVWGRTVDGQAYIGGKDGLILQRRTSNGEWEMMTQLPQASDVNGIWGAPGSNRLVAIGDVGRIWRYDGAGWSVDHAGDVPILVPGHDPAVDLHAVWGTGPDEIYAVGDDFTIVEFDGLAWSVVMSDGPAGSDSSDDFNAIWGTSSDDIYAAGDRSTLRHFDGQTWSDVALPSVIGSDTPLRGIWGTSSSNIFVSGNDGITLHHDGTHWVALRPTVPEHLYGMWGTGSDNLYVIGNSGRIAHHSGMAWAQVELDTTEELHDVWGRATNDIFAVGDKGLVLHYDGLDWSRLTLVDGNGSELDTDRDLMAISGNSAGHVVIAGEDGTVLRFDGSAWHRDSLGFASDLRGAWMDETGVAHVVGQGGARARFDGTSWWVQDRGDTASRRFNSVWGSSPDDVWVVGDDKLGDDPRLPLIFRLDNDRLEPVELASNDPFRRVWGSGRDDVYVVGDDGELWHHDGETWRSSPSSTANNLRGVTGDDQGRRFAVGSNGTTVYHDGLLTDKDGKAIWQQVASERFERINSVWANRRMMVMVGENGVLEMLISTEP